MRVYWEDEAANNLEKIHKFLEIHFSRSFADKIIDRIFSKTELLEEFPEMGAIEQELLKHGLNIRYLVENNYKIFYSINQVKGVVEILSVFDTRQNPSKMLSKED